MGKDLIEYIAKTLVDNPDEVQVSEEQANDGVILHLEVAPSDVGQVIGKGGRIARAMRTVLAASNFVGEKGRIYYMLEVENARS